APAFRILREFLDETRLLTSLLPNSKTSYDCFCFLFRRNSTLSDRLLERTEEKKAAPSMLERMETSIDHFEVTHPELTSALSSLFTILSNAGI
ncbi:MAG: DUF4404 family protein, partial [Chloroflexi bacterium]|nr:DUF4404 family protein [Chloroflexota bacterium]